MTSKQRHERRYQRRVTNRAKKKQDFLQTLPSYDEVFTTENLWKAFWECRKQVSWKPSLQMTQQNLLTEINKLEDELKSPRGFRSNGFINFRICERGKMRDIRSVDIRERIVQRCFCDNYLVPLFTHSLIYDNGASLKDKGITFAIERLCTHLHNYYNKYKTNEGYILIYDFSKYFDSINHQELRKQTDALILDEKCRSLYGHLVDMFGDVGLGLGSQISQVSAILYPNKIDYHMQNLREVESCARYMDDGYAIFRTKEGAIKVRELLYKWAAELKININPKKIKILKLSQSFIFLKKRFFLTNTGRVVIRLNRDNIYKHKRKIKKLLGLVNQGKLALEDVKAAHSSWMGQASKFHNYKAIYNADKQIRRLIDDYDRTNLSGDCCCV